MFRRSILCYYMNHLRDSTDIMTSTNHSFQVAYFCMTLYRHVNVKVKERAGDSVAQDCFQ